jgi:hypothetical protein
MRRLALVAGWLLTVLVAVWAGANLFAKSEPRWPLSWTACAESCWTVRDVAGLLASAGLQHAPGWTPLLVAQSERCVALRHWKPEGRHHLVYLPKRDVKNIMSLTKADLPFLHDCLALARDQTAQSGVLNYRLVSNGPLLQHLSYFHFHVIAK